VLTWIEIWLSTSSWSAACTTGILLLPMTANLVHDNKRQHALPQWPVHGFCAGMHGKQAGATSCFHSCSAQQSSRAHHRLGSNSASSMPRVQLM
jgi:hypothetical protein